MRILLALSMLLAGVAQATPTIAIDACGDVCVGVFVECSEAEACASTAFTIAFPADVSVVSTALGADLDPDVFSRFSVLRPAEGLVRILVVNQTLPIQPFPVPSAMVTEICFEAPLACTPLAFVPNTFGYEGTVNDIGNAFGQNVGPIDLIEGGVSLPYVPPTYECGDFNGDGLVNTVDASLIQRYTVGSIPYGFGCDVNGDGACTVVDARLIQRHAVGVLDASQMTCNVAPEGGGAGHPLTSGVTVSIPACVDGPATQTPQAVVCQPVTLAGEGVVSLDLHIAWDTAALTFHHWERGTDLAAQFVQTSANVDGLFDVHITPDSFEFPIRDMQGEILRVCFSAVAGGAPGCTPIGFAHAEAGDHFGQPVEPIVTVDGGAFLARMGDSNADGFVDGADYTVWADNFGMAGTNMGPSVGDFNGDGTVDGADYTSWADAHTGSE